MSYIITCENVNGLNRAYKSSKHNLSVKINNDYDVFIRV